MNILQKTKIKIQQRKVVKSLSQDAFAFAKAANIPDPKLFAKDFMVMARGKNTIYNIVEDMSLRTVSRIPENQNVAMGILGAMLTSVLMISSSDKPQYSFETLEFLSEMCIRITGETGSAGDQFELMVKTAQFEEKDKDESSEE